MNIGGSSLPSMLNYFHVYYSDVVLWQSWVPTTQGQYVGTIFAILAFGVVSTGLKTLSACLVSLSETNSRGYVKLGIMGAGDPLSVGSLLEDEPVKEGLEPWPLLLPRSGIQVLWTLIQSLILAFALMFDYFNMLIIMTYNVGFFVAVVMGYVLGNILCSHIHENFLSEHFSSSQQEHRQEEDMEQKM